MGIEGNTTETVTLFVIVGGIELPLVLDIWEELSKQFGRKLLGENEKNGIGQSPVDRIQEKLCNTFAQILSHSAWQHKALCQIVAVP
jgi:hypothetical protein